MSDKFKKNVFCISAEKLYSRGKWEGLMTKDLDEYYKLLLDNGEFKIRGPLETDQSYKQIIPQVVLRNNGKYFLHRQVAADEKRLDSLAPLPLGGHVDTFDVNTNRDLIQEALMRELQEEASIDANIVSRHFLGLISLNDNPVNSVHVGLMYVFDLDGQKVQMKEDGLETIGWVTVDYLQKHIEELTYWSRVLVEENLL